MFKKRVAGAMRTLLPILMLTLFMGGLVAPTASAADGSGDASVEALIDMFLNSCRMAGGKGAVHYEFDENFHIIRANVTCGGASGSWGTTFICSIYADATWWCARTGASESTTDSVRPTTGGVGGVVETEQAPTSAPIVLDADDTGTTQVTSRPVEPQPDDGGETGDAHETPLPTPTTGGSRTR